jgi:hypothetical protein
MRAILTVLIAALAVVNLAWCAAAQDQVGHEASDGSPCLPDIQVLVGAPQTFATHAELASYGFRWGPSDGNFGGIPMGSGKYTFFGTGGASSCRRGSSCEGAFTFSGTLDHVRGGKTTQALFGPGAGPAGWMFDRDYAGGGHVVRFDDREGHAGWFMSFHGEYHWKNPANPPGYQCFVGSTKSRVACFYSSIGLAASLDPANTFTVAGQIMQPTQPLSTFVGSASNMTVGYGSLLIADKHGRHINNPPLVPSEAYFYLVFSDQLAANATGVGACAGVNCMGIARARYDEVIRAALSGDPHWVARVFHKYDGAFPDAWTQSATSDTADLSGTAGSFAPLWSDGGAYQGSVIYDRDLDVYLAAYQFGRIYVRASKDLIHWTGIIGIIPSPTMPAASYYYPTLIGETGDPTVAGLAPRVYFSSFPVNAFPDWTRARFEYVQLTLTRSGHLRHGCKGR